MNLASTLALNANSHFRFTLLMQHKLSAAETLDTGPFTADTAKKVKTTKYIQNTTFNIYRSLPFMHFLQARRARNFFFTTTQWWQRVRQLNVVCIAPAHSLIRKPLPPQHQHLSSAINSLIISDLKELFRKKTDQYKRKLQSKEKSNLKLKRECPWCPALTMSHWYCY